MGPSGAGKDTLIDGARKRLNSDSRFLFARRIITRAADAPGEHHDSLDEGSFEALRAAGGLALSWDAHGLSYGLPASIEPELAAGRHVVANVSRAVLVAADARFAPLGIILVTAPPRLLAARIVSRGRETAIDAAARLSRPSTPSAIEARAITICNDGSIEAGTEAFIAALETIARRSREPQA